MTYVFRLSGNSSNLLKRLSHTITNDNLKVALTGFYTSYLTPNISKFYNILHYEENGDIKELIIPIGQYSVSTLEKYINSQPPFNTNNISIQGNDATNRINITSPFKLHLDKNSIGVVLGYDTKVEPNVESTGAYVPKFHPFETINIHCNLAHGMYIKEDDYRHKKSNIIASFRTNAEFKEPIIYEPAYPLFFSLQHLEFDMIYVDITDENGVPIDFGDSTVSVILQVSE